MCTAYELGKRGGSFPEWLAAEGVKGLLGLDGKMRIVRPKRKGLVVTPDGELREMEWGFTRVMRGVAKKEIVRTIVNSREDKLGGLMWRDAFRERRCLIPAAGFFEWVDGRNGGKVPLRFVDPGGGWLWIAGIWEEDRERGPVYSMITTEPTMAIASVHDRMPAVLVPGQMRPFLDGELGEFGPSAAALIWGEAENFLKTPGERTVRRRGKQPPDDGQATLW